MINKKLLASIRFQFAQCVFNTTIQYKAKERIEKEQNKRRVIALIIISATLLTLISQVIFEGLQDKDSIRFIGWIGLFCTGASLIFEVFNKDDLSEQKSRHRVAAENYLKLRGQYTILIEEYMSNPKMEKEIRKTHQEYTTLYSTIGSQADTTYDDYTLAQKSLNLGKNGDESFTWSDEEIDSFLLDELKLANQDFTKIEEQPN